MHKSPVPHFCKNMGAASIMVAALLLLAACASTPEAPTTALSEARNAIASAEQAGARQYAGNDLDEASRKLAMAESAVSSERMLEAEQYAQQSRITAELAIAKAAAAKAKEINDQLKRDAEALSEELERMGEQR